MATLKLNKLRDVYNMECMVCSDTFKNPKILPCLHTFCESCLEANIRGGERFVCCPTCQQNIPLPTKGVDAFPSNSFVCNMLNVLTIQNPTACTNCEDRELASSRCLDCVENLCSNCVTAHERIRQTKDHVIVSFEELQNNAVHDALKCPSFCSVHDREMLKYFCETCDDAICRDCAIYDHREHNYVDLKEAVKTHRGSITSLLDNSKRKIPIVKLALNEVIGVTESLNHRRELVQEAIQVSVDYHRKAVEEKGKKLLKALEDMYGNKHQVLDKQRQTLEIDLHNLLSSCDFVENILRYGNEAEIMIVKKMMTVRLQNLVDHKPATEPKENDVLEFETHDGDLKLAVTKFGRVSTTKAFPPMCTAEGNGIKQAKVGQLTLFQVFAKDRFGEPVDGGGDSVVVKVQDENGHVISAEVRDNHDGTYTAQYKPISKGMHVISAYLREKPIVGSPFEITVTAGIDCSKIGPMLLKFGSAGIITSGKVQNDYYEPWGLTTNQRGCILATDHNNHKIQVFDPNGKLMHQFGNRGKGDGEIWYPTGIAVDRQANIYVADHGNHRIQVFSSEGEFLRKFGVRGTGDGQLKGPCALAVDHTERLLIADRDNHRVQIFDLEGEFISVFGGSGNGDGKMNSPRHLAVSPSNEIVVSDTNNYRIQVFSSQGDYLYKFGTKGSGEGQFLCPSGIGIDSEGHVAIADFKNINVQLFWMDGRFIKKLGIEGAGIACFNKPTGLCISPNGNVLVADRGTHRIQVF